MKKSDLKTGMIIEFMNGVLGMVLLGTENGDIVSGGTWFPLSDHSDEMLFVYIDYETSIKAVYQPTNNMDYLNKGVSLSYFHTTLWERKEPKKMTLADIETELGYPIKIVGGQHE